MPPKNQSATTSSRVATKSTAATKTSATSGLVATNIAETKSNAKKRAASGPPEAERTTLDKKVRLTGEGLILLANSSVAQKEFSVGKGAQLSEEILEIFKDLKLTLSDHVPRSMAAIFEGIKYPDVSPAGTPIATQVDILIAELKRRVLSGKSIDDNLAVIEKVDKYHWAGEYDDDLDGLSKDVRMRVDDAEYMVARLTSSYLRCITRQLNPFSGCGSDVDMADEIVGILLHLAKQGKDIKREYMTVKANYTKCYGNCGHPSDPALNCGSEEY